jgi:hypothetical protein
MQTDRTGLWTASLVACGLFLAEDPAVIAARQHLRRSDQWGTSSVAIDVTLAAAMLGYNYLATRYVVRVASAEVIARAIAELDAERVELDAHRPTTWVGLLRATARALNPFNVLKQVAERAGTVIERAGRAARRSGRRGAAALLGDLAIVNLLGVPGAGIHRSTSGRDVTARESFRLCALFVASWFVGAWAIEAALDQVAAWPVVGGAMGAGWHALGTTYATATDVGTPVGAACVLSFLVVLLRYVRRVERRAASLERPH